MPSEGRATADSARRSDSMMETCCREVSGMQQSETKWMAGVECLDVGWAAVVGGRLNVGANGPEDRERKSTRGE